MDLDRATFLALAALLETADTCGETQIQRSLQLRALLAFVAIRTGEPKLARRFWAVATERHKPSDASGAYQSRYIRGTEARSCINAMLKLCGWEASNVTLGQMRDLYRERAKRMGAPRN